MKQSVIEAIFNGEKGCVEQIKMTKKEHRLISVVSDTYNELFETLTPEQKNLHKNSSTQEKAPFAGRPIYMRKALSWVYA